MPKISVFGQVDSPETRAALRFFRERRIVVTFTDLRKRGLAAPELRPFTEQLGIRAADVEGRLPLVRYGDAVTAGAAEVTWRAWLADRA